MGTLQVHTFDCTGEQKELKAYNFPPRETSHDEGVRPTQRDGAVADAAAPGRCQLTGSCRCGESSSPRYTHFLQLMMIQLLLCAVDGKSIDPRHHFHKVCAQAAESLQAASCLQLLVP